MPTEYNEYGRRIHLTRPATRASIKDKFLDLAPNVGIDSSDAQNKDKPNYFFYLDAGEKFFYLDGAPGSSVQGINIALTEQEMLDMFTHFLRIRDAYERGYWE